MRARRRIRCTRSILEFRHGANFVIPEVQAGGSGGGRWRRGRKKKTVLGGSWGEWWCDTSAVLAPVGPAGGGEVGNLFGSVPRLTSRFFPFSFLFFDLRGPIYPA